MNIKQIEKTEYRFPIDEFKKALKISGKLESIFVSSSRKEVDILVIKE